MKGTDKNIFEEYMKLHDTDWPVAERPAYRLLQDTAESCPDRTAVIACDRSLSYARLNAEANIIGHALAEAGAAAEVLVAVFADRDSYAYVMRQGVLKSGAAFLPLDPYYPEDRIDYILKDSASRILLTTGAILERRKDLFDRLAAEGMIILDAKAQIEANADELNADLAARAEAARQNLNLALDYDSLAYAIYTSGSTGRPKGVMLTNRNLVNFVDDDVKNREIQGFTRRGRVSLAIAALTFDVSIMEEFLPLANGMTVVLATKDQIMDPEAIASLIQDHQVDIMTSTPSYLSNLIDMDVFLPAVRRLKSVDLGAEAFPPALFGKLKEINPDLYIMNGYGPTEATISCTMEVVESGENISIGVPNVNVHVCVVNEDNQPLPLGEKGELVILGEGVGRGYIGLPEQNRKSFIELFGHRAYKSGDLARIPENGRIIFHGRLDNQVKLRGLRVELGEIEAAIQSFPGVGTAVVSVIKEQQEYLAAWFTAETKVDIEKLKAHVRKYLTAYMVPQAFMQLEEIPLTANGKVDKKALPRPEAAAFELVAPENEREEKLLDLAREVIGTDRIGVTTDLFEAGLSSLGAMRMCSEIHSAFGNALKTPDLAERSTVRQLASYLEKTGGDNEGQEDYGIRERYPLTKTQMGIYYETNIHSGTTIYNIPSLYKLDESVDMERLGQAIEKAVACHPYLLVQMTEDEDGTVWAVRRDEAPFKVSLIKADPPGQEDLVRPFDLLSGESLCRAELYEGPAGKYFFLDTHHIVSDGGSIDIMIRDINEIYLGRPVSKESYTGYELALDEEKARGDSRFEEARDWYDHIFKGCGGETLPVKDGKDEGRHIALKRTYARTDASQIRAYCDARGLTLNAFFTAAFGFALKAYTYSENAVFTTIYNGRNDPRLADSVAMLVKTLPVLLECDPGVRTETFISDCQTFLLNSMARDIYSFMEIRQAYDIQAEIMFAYQGELEHGAEIGGREAELTMLDISQARAAFGLDLSLDGDRIVFDREYDPAVFSAYTMDNFLELLDQVCQEMVRRDKLGEIRLTDQKEEEAIRRLHDTDWPVEDRPAYRLLQDAADKYPDRTAVIACDRSLSYRELNAQANALGRALKKAGAGPEGNLGSNAGAGPEGNLGRNVEGSQEGNPGGSAGAGLEQNPGPDARSSQPARSIVAVLADRDSYAYVMRQAVLKSGAAFLPLDPDYPEDRIDFILKDSGADLLVTTGPVMERRKDLFEKLAGEGMTILDALDILEGASGQDYDNLNLQVDSRNLAYVIYTSGSTGRPKGVMLTNRNLVNFVDDNEKNREIQGFTRRGRVSLAIAALTFDVSIMEEFLPIANGMTVVLASKDQIMDPEAIASLILEYQVDIMTATPSYMSNLISLDVFLPAARTLKTVDLGAEAFPPALYGKLYKINPDLHIMNGYGPTEATISCTMEIIDQGEDITIGIPNGNVHVATIDRDGRLQPLGATGEMVILGQGVGRGYVGLPDKTRESFIRMLGLPAYRSGDLVRFRKDGKIEFHGRTDNQVKLRGLRVELGEIEHVMNTFPGLKSSVVRVKKDASTEYLAAWFTADKEIDLEDLKKHLSSRLTEYMVPQVFLQLAEMPLTANGKVDIKALPEPQAAEEQELVLPENDLQRGILEAVAEAIGTDRISIMGDLFAQGLSSLGSIVLSAKLLHRFHQPIKVSDIFKYRTIKDLADLISHKEGQDGEGDKGHPLQEMYPLSMTQQGILADSLLYAGSTVYNIPYLYKLDDKIVLERLRAALEKTVLAHPYLHMTIAQTEDGKAEARRRKPDHVEIPLLKVMPSQEELIRPYDLLSGEPLYRLSLFDTAEGKYLFMDTHHIVSDGVSINILLEDINKAYEDQELEEETYSGFEFALDESRARASGQLETARNWYDSVCRGCEQGTLPRSENCKTDETCALRRQHGTSNAGAIVDYCRRKGFSLNAFFTTAFGLALKAYTGSESAVFTTIYNGRSDPRTERSVAMFVKTLPIVMGGKADQTVYGAVEASEDYLIQAMANDIFSFAEIKEAYGISADVLFAYQGDYEEDLTIGGLPARIMDSSLSQAKSPFGIDLYIDGDRLLYEAEYEPARYSDYTIDGFIRMMDLICGQMTSKEMVRDLELVDDQDKDKILKLHDTDWPVADRPAYRLLQDSADRYPDRTAVIACDRSLSYRELNAQANALGRALKKAGAGPERNLGGSTGTGPEQNPGGSTGADPEMNLGGSTGASPEENLGGSAGAGPEQNPLPDAGSGQPVSSIVAVLADRDSYAYIMRQAVLKSGAAFLPLDPDYPEDRIDYILGDSGAKLLVTTGPVMARRKDLFERLAGEGMTILDAREILEGAAGQDYDNLNLQVDSRNLAYVIYTSGSTGRPKGVMLTNRNLVNFVDDNEKNREIQGFTKHGPVSLALAALTFDVSIMEEFLPIANGMTVVLATKDQIMDPEAISTLIQDHRIDIMTCTPSYMSNLINLDIFRLAARSLKAADLGAEAFPPALYDKLHKINPDLYIMNGYGPTEATISCTMEVIESGEDITIGLPNANVHVATIDRDGRPQPLGATGEMVILGQGVGRGYVGLPDKTRESFIRMLGLPAYRSGDLVRLRKDGKIEFHGRTDNQVKLRGLRVELGEIEHVMNTFPGLKSSVVRVKKDPSTEYLAAWFTADKEIDLEDLKKHLSSRLTEYMVPQVFLQLAEMPLTANGKVDTKALPDISADRKERKIIKPVSDLQRKLCGFFEKALEIGEVGITENFFELGGTSLKASLVLMAGRLEKLPFVYQDIFNCPTVEGLEKLILENEKKGQAQGEGLQLTELAPKQENEAQKADGETVEETVGAGRETASLTCLACNSNDHLQDLESGDLGNVLLTGATGFLGIHVLRDLLIHTDEKVYCLMRAHKVNSLKRLASIYYYYFNESCEEEFGKRIFVIDGDITMPDSLKTAAREDFRTIINCAACVKHFADIDFLMEVNFRGVEYLTDICLAKGLRLIQTSTVSVGGDIPEDHEEICLAENCLDLGQEVKANAYVYTKYLAEKHVLEAVEKKGLDAKIIRLGNLASRSADEEFQMNFATNNFMNTLKAYAVLGCFPQTEMSLTDEFSYIDETARAVVLLSGTGSQFTVFHAYNSHTVDMGNIIMAMNACDIPVKVVKDSEFKERLKEGLADMEINKYLSPLINYDLAAGPVLKEVGSENFFTVNALYQLGFAWTITDMEFIEKALEYMKGMGFFDF